MSCLLVHIMFQGFNIDFPPWPLPFHGLSPFPVGFKRYLKMLGQYNKNSNARYLSGRIQYGGTTLAEYKQKLAYFQEEG